MASIVKNYNILWDTNYYVPHWYNLEGSCATSSAESTGFEPNDANCSKLVEDEVWIPVGWNVKKKESGSQKFLQSVLATSLQDLCAKIKQISLATPLRWPINSIKKSNHPAYWSDDPEIMNYGSNADLVAAHQPPDVPPDYYIEFVPQDFSHIEECLSFSLVGDGVTSAGATVTYMDFEHSMGLVLYETSYGPVFYDTFAGADVTMPYFAIDYPQNEPTNIISITPDNVLTLCGCGSLPPILKMQHNFSVGNALYNFIQTNGYNLPNLLDMRYSATSSSWRSQLHFVGVNSSGGQERWDLIFEWKCNSDEITDWRFTAKITKLDLSTGKYYDTRMVYSVELTPVCLQDGQIDLSMSIDTQNNGAVTTNVPMVITADVFYDAANVFSGSYWNKNNLQIKIANSLSRSSSNSLDVSSIFPKD